MPISTSAMAAGPSVPFGEGDSVARVPSGLRTANLRRGPAREGWRQLATVVVCDDDKVVRAAVSSACADAGLEVVAETDSGSDAAEMVRRFGVDVLVIDVALSDGSGEHTLVDARRGDGCTAAVIVFTALRPRSRASSGGWASTRWWRSPTSRCSATCWRAVVSTAGRHPGRRPTVGPPAATSSSRRSCGARPPGSPRTRTSPTRSSRMETGDAVLAVTVVGPGRRSRPTSARCSPPTAGSPSPGSCGTSSACRTCSTRHPRCRASWR